uniref:LolA-like domain-containing protein n=1 Tax=Ciona savignyi TaxID=51511 RepID=H2YBP3_CIOSA
MFLEIWVLALVAGTGAAGLCPNTTGRIPVQMPQLDQSMFSYKIQINVPDAEKTLDAFEYYDHVNKSIFLYLDQTNMGKRTMQRVMYDYKYNQTFNVDELSNTCSVKDLTSPNDQITLFGAGVENGPDGVNNSFFWNAGYNSTYEGNATIDGVFTDHYQTCLTFENDTVTYLIDVFFSAINWSMPAAQRAPVKLTLNASTTVNNVTTSRMYFYKFSDYHTMATPDDWKPERPSGMICPGRKDGPTISPMDMEQLSLKYEIYTMTSEDRIS